MSDAQDRLERRQEAELRRRNEVRRATRRIPCEDCFSVVDEPCSNKGNYRVHNHKSRLEQALTLGLIYKDGRGRYHVTKY